MVKQLTIINFRSITFLKIDLSKTTIIKGQNKLGKSTILNALSWLLTGKLLTDKWGAGENNIQSIKPTLMGKNDITTVEIELDTGTTFKKQYIARYDGDKVVRHDTKVFINNVNIKTLKDFEFQMNQALNYVPYFRTVEEPRLFTDPLYALQKLNPNDLRKFLIELGASVEASEVFALGGFKALKPFAKKYNDDFSLMRTDLKKEILSLKAQINQIEYSLNGLIEIKEFNPAKLIELENSKRELIEKKVRVRDASVDIQIERLNLEIKELISMKEKHIKTLQDGIYKSINEAKIKYTQVKKRIELETKELTFDLNSKISGVKSRLDGLASILENLNYTLNASKSQLQTSIQLGKSSNETKALLAQQLAELVESKYESMVECPCCQTVFASNPEEFANFESEKQAKIIKLQKRIEAQTTRIAELKVACETTKASINKNLVDIDATNAELVEKRAELSKLTKELTEVKSKVNMVELEELKELIRTEELRLMQPINTKEFDDKINELYEEINKIEFDHESKIFAKAQALELEIMELKEPIDAEYALKSKWESKLAYLKDLENVRTELNNKEELLVVVNKYIQAYLELLHNKAKQLTGLHFVLQEENLSNERMTDCCYALVGGVQFDNINTAEKYIIGIEFIEQIKKILAARNIARNDFPILADRLEGIDCESKILDLASETQLICTRVSEDGLTILNH